MNKYWFENNKKLNYDYFVNFTSKFFRLINSPYDETDTLGLYRTREELKCIYLSRMWILRYNEWFILNFYSLRPKETNLVIKQKKKVNTINSSIVVVQKQNSLKLLKRLKFLIAYFFYKTLNENNYLF